MDYQTHAKFSLQMAYIFAIGSVKAVVHAILPDFYVSSTSDIVKEVEQHLQGAGCRNEDQDVNKKIE
tara:strand:- start:434 stop:634 length:201 start_codon:yes stop_codon:yes gene_type:complete